MPITSGLLPKLLDKHVLNIRNSIKLYIFIHTDVQACRCGSKPGTLLAMPPDRFQVQSGWTKFIPYNLVRLDPKPILADSSPINFYNIFGAFVFQLDACTLVDFSSSLSG